MDPAFSTQPPVPPHSATHAQQPTMSASPGSRAPFREAEGSSLRVLSPLDAPAPRAGASTRAFHIPDLRDFTGAYSAPPSETVLAASAGHRSSGSHEPAATAEHQHPPQPRTQLPRQPQAHESQQQSPGTASDSPAPLSYGQFGTPTPSSTGAADPVVAGPANASAISLAPPVNIVENPPDLDQWRQRLFDLEKPVILTAEAHETYFPWIDNIYSHRSSQRYKRKSFVTHYYDCRLKGRPPGAPKKNADPDRKKRKRKVREIDLCDVKIKITEYRAGSAPELQRAGDDLGMDSSALQEAVARVGDAPFWVMQRIVAGGTNGSGHAKPATHKHDLRKSDEIKKSTAHRLMAERERAAKRSLKQSPWKPRGNAAATAKAHAKDANIKFYSACFCPFSQRVWIALEAKRIEYQYCETYPLRTPKPQNLLDANPRGLVPAIQENRWACGESSVILEYLEDQDSTVPLYPTNSRLKANCRLWIDFINTRIVPSFYSVLAATEDEARGRGMRDLQRHLSDLVQAAEEKGPYFLGEDVCLVDVHLAPFALRLSRLRPFVDLPPPTPQPRWQQWLDALERNPHVRSTTSADQLYTESIRDLLQGFMWMS